MTSRNWIFRLCAWLIVAAFSTGRADPAQLRTPGRFSLHCLTNQVGQFEKIEFELAVPREYTNPFDPAEVEITVHLVSPSGTDLSLPAFYCQEYERKSVRVGMRNGDWLCPRGPAVWKARYSPMEIGTYLTTASLRDRDGTLRTSQAAFQCGASNRRGYVRVSKTDSRFLELSTSQPFFPIGQNLAFIGEAQHVTLAKAEQIFGQLAAHGANYLRIWTCCDDWALAIEARKSAWGRSWEGRTAVTSRPDDPPELRCVRIASDHPTLTVNPSHPVALRPDTRYVVTGKVSSANNSKIRLEIAGAQPARLDSDERGAWTPFRYEFTTGATDFWLSGMGFRLEGSGPGWIRDLSLRQNGEGPELLWEAAVNRPTRGFYNPADCFMLDQLVAAAERSGIYLQLCLLTRDLYMGALKKPASPEYAQAIADAKKLLRYAVARWGYSAHVAAWEYWNEMDPNLPTDEFYAELGRYLDQMDLYHHLRTTSTWGASAKDCHHAQLDLADAHFYLRPSDQGRLRDEVEAVIDRTHWLREQAPAKPAHLGEFGLADEKWQLTGHMKQSAELVDFHNALWASALSGASGTAMYWWWERLDQRNAYPIYRPLSRFVADVPWTSGELKAEIALSAEDRVRVLSLRARSKAWLWFFNRAASWAQAVVASRSPAKVEAVTLDLQMPKPAPYRVEWWDTDSGQLLREDRLSGQVIHLCAPAFTRDVACKVRPE